MSRYYKENITQFGFILCLGSIYENIIDCVIISHSN